MKTRLIKISDISKMSGMSMNSIRNYINGGYYDKNGKFRVLDVDFPKPVKIIGRTRLFEEIAVRRFFNLA